MKNVGLSLITALFLAAAHAAPLIMRAHGTAEPLASPPPQDKTNGPESQACRATLQAAGDGDIEAVAVPRDERLVLLHEDAL